MADILQTVKSVLSSPSARRIDFHFGLIHVDAAGLALIHSLVSVGTVPVKIVTMGSKNVAAQYDNDTNTLELPRANYGADAKEKSDILHECVHALHDIYGGGYYHARGGSRFLTASDNEAAAYIADALYFLYETGRTQSAVDPIFVKAAAIAKRIRNQPGAFVSTAEALDLRQAIISDVTYGYDLNTPTPANGP